MRRLFVLGALFAAAACAPVREPLEVDWTFGGKSCVDAGVAKIQIDMDGQVLTPNVYTCDEAGQGVALGDFLTGVYRVTVTGFDADGNTVYQTTQDIQVKRGGSNVVRVDAAPVTGTATLDWTFGGKSCAAAGVTAVEISVDGTVITTAPGFPCSNPNASGQVVDGSTIGPLSAGSHTFSLAADGSDGTHYAVDNVTANVAVGQDTPVQVDLPVATPTTASADVRWLFEPGDKNCAAAGVDTIHVIFDPQSNGTGGTEVATIACAGMGGVPVTESNIVDVPDGNHSFAIRGTHGNTLLYYTHAPVTTLFTAPFTTIVDVQAQPTP